MLNCQRCGASNRDDAAFCRECGDGLGPSATEIRAAEPPVTPLATDSTGSVTTSPSTASRRNFVVAALFALSIAALLGAILFVMSGDDDSPRSNAAGSTIGDTTSDLVTSPATAIATTAETTAAPTTVAPTTAAPTTAAPTTAAPTTVAPTTAAPTTAAPTTTVVQAAPLPQVTQVAATIQRSDSIDACSDPTTYPPSFAFDGDTETAWMAPGDGAGESITFFLAEPSVISRLGLVPGYDKFDPCTGNHRFFELRRITAVEWSFDDGTAIRHDLVPMPTMQVIELDDHVVSSTVRMTILSTAPPGVERLDHTPVSEIRLG